MSCKHPSKPAILAATPTPSLRSRYSLFTRVLHWVSAFLMMIILATSLGSGLGLTSRFPANWMTLHLTVGVSLLVLTTMRLSRSLRSMIKSGNGSAWPRNRQKLAQSALLVLALTVIASGLIIYQPSPLGRPSYVFGILSMPTVVRLDHAIHGKVIVAHITIAVVLFSLMLVHIGTALSRDRKTGRFRLGAMI